MKLSRLLAPLIAAKVPHDVIMETVLAYEAQQIDALEASREKARNRWHKWNDKRAANVSKRLPTDSNTLARAVEDKPLPTDNNQSKKHIAASGVVEFKAKLSEHLEPELLGAFVAVRKAKRAAFSGLAANLFVADAAKCGMTVSQAATECVRSNWITVKPEYFANRQRAGPAPKPPSIADIAGQLAKGMKQADELRSDQSSSSTRALIPDLSVISGGRSG